MLDISTLPLCIVVLIPPIIAFTFFYFFFHGTYCYWKRRGVPTPKPLPPFGNFARSFLTFSNPRLQMFELYKALEDEKFVGLYSLNKPVLLLRDPQLIKQVLVKDFPYFHIRGFETNEDVEPLQGHLFAISGSKWRNLRVRLTPTFTSGKIKMMFPALVEAGKEMQDCLKRAAANEEAVEINDVLRRYTIDIIASCAFGINCNSLRNPDSEFRVWGKKIFDVPLTVRLILTISTFIPSFSKIFNVNIFPPDVSRYFRNMVKETVEYREKNNVHRNDFMQLMIQLKNKTLHIDEDDPLLKINIEESEEQRSSTSFEVTLDVIAAQAFIFFIAGFETSSTTMTFCLYELALTDIQARLRSEVDSVLKKYEEITYETIQEMKYLDKVVKETLRKYPPLTGVTRRCVRATKLAGTDLTVEKEMQVEIPIMGLHRDPKYYPNPEKFDPERFTEEEINKRPQYTYIPFGEGPRICIGMRFALLETKVGLISLLSNYEVQVSKKTQIPLIFDRKAIVLIPKGGLWLKVINRTDQIVPK